MGKVVIIMANKPKTLDGRINAVIRQAAALGPEIHAVAMDCLRHCAEHRDTSKIYRLATELHKGQRVQTLRAWVMMFTPIRFKADKAIIAKDKDGGDVSAFDLGGAEAAPYYDIEETPAERQLGADNFDKDLATLVGKYAKALAGEAKNAVVNDDDRDAVKLRVAAVREFLKRGYRVENANGQQLIAAPEVVAEQQPVEQAA